MHTLLKFQVGAAEKWEQLKAAVATKLGLQLSDSGGTAQSKGVTVAYTWTPATGIFTLEVEKESFYDPSELSIDKTITTALASLGIEPAE